MYWKDTMISKLSAYKPTLIWAYTAWLHTTWMMIHLKQFDILTCNEEKEQKKQRMECKGRYVSLSGTVIDMMGIRSGSGEHISVSCFSPIVIFFLFSVCAVFLHRTAHTQYSQSFLSRVSLSEEPCETAPLKRSFLSRFDISTSPYESWFTALMVHG